MSIDARVTGVSFDRDGTGRLTLEDRPAKPGGHPGIAGQKSLSFTSAPDIVTNLIGLNIWGGSDSILLGEHEIAERWGYTRIKFVSPREIRDAIEIYNKA